MRLVGKAQGCWQCSTCSVRYTQLHRQWGGWPPKEFESLDPEAKAQFWQDIQKAPDAASQEELVLKTLSHRIIESRISGEKGSFQPLGWYQAQGYDVKRIEKYCKDTEEHPVLGTTYRVDINYQDKKKELQRVREEFVKSIRDRKHGKGHGKGQSKGGGKGKSKGKPAGNPTVATKKMQGDAVKILAKVSPISYGIKCVLRNKKINLLPSTHVDLLSKFAKELAELENEAQKTVSQQAVLNTTLASVGEKSCAANNHLNLMKGFLASF
jgi:hypothetical protein